MAGGSLLGSLFSAWVSDRRGRRDSMSLAAAVFVAGSALMSAAQGLPMLVVARAVNGFAVGIFASQGSVYLAEISTPSRRGRLIALYQWMITWGVSMNEWLNACPLPRACLAPAFLLAPAPSVWLLVFFFFFLLFLFFPSCLFLFLFLFSLCCYICSYSHYSRPSPSPYSQQLPLRISPVNPPTHSPS